MHTPPLSRAVPRRRALARLLALGAAVGAPAAFAQTAAASAAATPLRLIVPLSTGSTADIVARVLAPPLASAAGRAVTIDNLPGFAGVTGTAQLVRAPADGSTLAVVSSNHVINPSIYKSMPFDALADITPIAILGYSPLALVVAPPLVPARTTRELVALLKAEPGRYRYGSAGAGTVLHLAGELFRAEAGVDLKHVPYKGTGPLVADLEAGLVDLAFVSVTAVAPQVKAGRLRAIAVSTAQRTPVLPGVPTLAESGLPGYDFSAWLALIGPPRLPRPLVARTSAELKTVLAQKAVQDALAAVGFRPLGGTPEQAEAFFRSERERHAALVRRAGVLAE